MTEAKRIPLAPSVRWRKLRRKFVPIACFAVTVVACGYLWQKQGAAVHTVGEVDALRVNVTAPATGLVEAFPGSGRVWRTFDRVEAGELLGTIRVAGQGDEEQEVIELRAPVGGTLVMLDCWPGQTLIAGSPVATIAAERGRHIVSYVNEGDALNLEPGAAITVRARRSGSRLMETQIEAIGEQIEMIPLHQNANPASPQWGLPVRIRMPSEAEFRPGTLVDVVFNNR